MNQNLRGKRLTFKRKENQVDPSRMVALLSLILDSLWFFYEIVKPCGRSELLFIPTPTATRTVNSISKEAQSYFQAGIIYDPEGKNGIDAYREVLEKQPDNALARTELAHLLTYSSSLLSTSDERAERLASAREVVEHTVQDASNNSTSFAIKALVLDLSATSTVATAAQRQEWFTEAEQAANLAITRIPNNSLPLAFYVEVLRDQNQKAQALDKAHLPMERGPDLMDTHSVYDMVLEALGKYRSAIEEYKKRRRSTHITPTPTESWVIFMSAPRIMKEDCTVEENEVGGVAVEPMELTNYEVAYYYARYSSVLDALSRPDQNNRPKAIKVLDTLEASYGGRPHHHEHCGREQKHLQPIRWGGKRMI